jgi:hypothetical protein
VLFYENNIANGNHHKMLYGLQSLLRHGYGARKSYALQGCCETNENNQYFNTGDIKPDRFYRRGALSLPGQEI